MPPYDATSVFSGNPISSMGLPIDYLGNPIPSGLDGGTSAAIPPAPPLSSSQSWWDTLKNDTLGGVQWVETTASDAVKGAYGVVKGAVGTVVSDVTAPVADAAKQTYVYLIVGVVVLAVALYYVGKGGLIGQVKG